MAKITCPGCGAEIDSEKLTAEFRAPVEPTSTDDPDRRHGFDPSSTPARPAATPRAGNAFFKPRKQE